MADGGPPKSDLEALRLTRKESRAVLDHQIATLNDLDDKAMRTVRTDVILLGILASAAGIAGPERLNQLDVVVQILSLAAGGCLFLSAIVGTGVYAVSDLSVGIGPSYRSEIRSQGYTEREWLEILLGDYDHWTNSMRQINENNAFYLTVTQALLALALVSLFGATSLLAIPLEL